MPLSMPKHCAFVGRFWPKPTKTGVGLAICLSLLVACHPNGSNLQNATEFYYAPGAKTQNNPKDTYKLLSSKSKTQLDIEQWISSNKKHVSPTRIEVLRQEERQGTIYALVQLTREEDGYQDIYTHTWAREDGKWRRLVFKRTAEESKRALSNGDYTSAKAKAEEWLTLDPFCMEAYNNLCFATERSGFGGNQSRTLNDIIRAVISINPKDSSANFLAVTWTADPRVAKNFLKHLENNRGYAHAAFNLALKFAHPSDRISFLDEQKDEPILRLIRIQTLAQLGRWEECRMLLATKENCKSFKSAIDGGDPSFGANHAAILGLVSLACEQTTEAQEWLDLGVSKDPNNPRITILANIVGRPERTMLARHHLLTQF